MSSSQLGYQEHRDEILKRQREKYKNDQSFRQRLLDYQKQYNSEHREDYLKKQKEYYITNKDKIKAQRAEKNVKITCECGRKVLTSSMCKHILTPLHEKTLQKLRNNSNSS
jgi:hypothetical protein